MPASKTRVGFAGCGHPHIFSRLRIVAAREDCEIVGIFDQSVDTAAQIGRDHHVPVADTLDALLVRDPELVIVEALDPEIPAIAAPLAGTVSAVLLEKPGAPDLPSLVALLRGFKAKGTIVEFGYQLHYSPAIDRAATLLGDGSLGQVTLARFHASTPVGCSLELWQSLPGDLGGLMFTEGCHMLELVVSTLGTPTAVNGAIRKFPTGASVSTSYYKPDLFAGEGARTVLHVGTGRYEDVGTATLHYPDAIGVLDLTGWEAEDWVSTWTMEFYGTLGTLRVRIAPPIVELHLPHGSSTSDPGTSTWRPPDQGRPSTYERQLDDLIRRTRGEPASTGVDLATGLDVVRILDAIYRSDTSGGAYTELRGVAL